MFKKLPFYLPLLCLIGCAHTPSVDTLNPTVSTTPEVADTKTATPGKAATPINTWEIRGLMGVKSPKKAFSAQFIWLQQGATHYNLRLMGPFGNGTVVIQRRGGAVSYQDEHRQLTSNNASSLFQKTTGISLPVEALYYWIRGLPAPGGSAQTTYDTQHHLTTLQQAGYRIQYTQYETVNDYALPKKLLLTGNGLVIKVIVKSWALGSR